MKLEGLVRTSPVAQRNLPTAEQIGCEVCSPPGEFSRDISVCVSVRSTRRRSCVIRILCWKYQKVGRCLRFFLFQAQNCIDSRFAVSGGAAPAARPFSQWKGTSPRQVGLRKCIPPRALLFLGAAVGANTAAAAAATDGAFRIARTSNGWRGIEGAGGEPVGTPRMIPEEQRLGESSWLMAERPDSNDARPVPLPLSDDGEPAERVHTVPAAAATATTGAAGAADEGGRGGSDGPAVVAAANFRADAEGFGPEWTTRHHRRLATTSSEALCDGILDGDVCCGSECGKCGGTACSSRGGGADDCCRGNIMESGILCSDNGGASPCIVDGKGQAADEEKMLMRPWLSAKHTVRFVRLRFISFCRVKAERCMLQSNPQPAAVVLEQMKTASPTNNGLVLFFAPPQRALTSTLVRVAHSS